MKAFRPKAIDVLVVIPDGFFEKVVLSLRGFSPVGTFENRFLYCCGAWVKRDDKTKSEYIKS